MRKIAFILFIFVLAACSSTRKLSRSGTGPGSRKEFSVEDVLERNITAGNFSIPKCEIGIKTDEMDEKFLAAIKYEFPGKYLITLKTGLGIELARIFVTSDTILANDRINRVLYFGKPSVLAYKYGIPFDIIPVIFGDLVINNEIKKDKIPCTEDRNELDGVIEGRKISYDIDCRKMKISGLIAEGSGGRDNATVKYYDFIQSGNLVTPSRIEIANNGSANMITLRIDKIEKWEGKIDFIPGNRYKRIELR